MDQPGSGPRVAIKDLIDVVGTPTTAGCAVVARQAEPADHDAACMAGLRAADVAIVGKANLHELACGGTGVNEHFGTPVNPFDPACIPGGSSSGSAVALADGEVDIALGSDTAGSIRNPSACCGTAGLKTTWGRIPLDGVWPLAPSLDTVGPMARDVAGVIDGMALLEPGFAAADDPAPVIGRVRLPDVDPVIDAAVDAALAASELEVVDLVLPGWEAALEAGWRVMFHEVWTVDHHLLELDAAGLGRDVREAIELGGTVGEPAYEAARSHRDAWRAELADAFERTPVLAWPTLRFFPPRIGEPALTRWTNLPVNHAGHPGLALPVPAPGRFPASVELVGPDHTEDLLCATGLVIEAAAATL